MGMFGLALLALSGSWAWYDPPPQSGVSQLFVRPNGIVVIQDDFGKREFSAKDSAELRKEFGL